MNRRSPSKREMMGSEGFQAEEQSEQRPGRMTYSGTTDKKVGQKCGP